ncbi:ABC transporter substrate-binding protein [Brevibacillus sp. GCM10020057]|uniref:SgrR family transcriptional regulator n=1 Tax=Brevibacillus sp. GCM10020057 TaxID=3317327 RepID=UPI0036312BD2
MQLVEQYVLLYAGCRAQAGRPLEISLTDVAEALFCTQRNATLTLKKMQSQGWIRWQSGRGRGHRSVLTCLLTPDELVLSAAKELVQRGEIHASRKLIDAYREQWHGLGEAYSRWMTSQFGLHRLREKGNGVRMDTLRFFVDRPFSDLDPVRAVLRSQTHLAKHIFDTLVRFDPQTGAITGQLAFAWECDRLGKEWVFTLRKGVLFHHGRQLAADDVCFSLQRLAKEPSRHRWLAQSIHSVRALDEYAVAVALNEPDQLFLHALSKEYASIVPREYVTESSEAFAAWPIGTGPFKVVRNDTSMLALEAFQPYFAGRPFLDRVELWCVPGGMHVDTANDELQLVRAAIGEQETGRLGTAWRGLSRREQCFQYVSFNSAKPGPLRQPAFRAALASMIQGERMRAELKGARQPVEAWGELLTLRSVHQPGGEEAAISWSGVGYEGETLLLYTYPDPDHAEDAEWIRESCAKAGITVEIVYALPEELARPQVLQAADLVVDSANVDERLELSLLEFVFAEALSIWHHLDEQAKKEMRQRAMDLRGARTDSERSAQMKSMLAALQARHTFVPLYSNRLEMRAHPRLSGISMDAFGWIDFSRAFVRV